MKYLDIIFLDMLYDDLGFNNSLLNVYEKTLLTDTTNYLSFIYNWTKQIVDSEYET